MKNNKIKKGAIHYVDFGQPSSFVIAGIRPAIIISTSRQTVTVVPITSNRSGINLEGEIPIPAGIGGLKIDSKIKIYQIQSVDIKQVKAPIGQLSHNLLLQIISYIEYHMLMPLLISNDVNTIR